LHPYTRMLMAAMPGCAPQGKKKEMPVRGEAGDTGDTGGEGCSFKNRCIYKIAVCDEEVPELRPHSGRGLCACHRTGEI